MDCQLANATVYYEQFGDGRPFVVIPGMPSDHRIALSWLEPFFATRPGWQRLYFDLPGTGRTPGAEWITSIDQVLDVVCEFVDAVLPGERFTLLGLSAGGYLARGVVHRKAALVDGLCLLVPWLSDQPEHALPSLVTLVRDPAVAAQLGPDEADVFEGLFVVQSRKVLDWYRDVVLPAREGVDWSWLDRLGKTYSFDLDAVSEPFDGPTLILTGRQDTHVGYREGWQILERYPRATFAVLDRAGHGLGVEQEELFQALLGEWLDRVESFDG
jgi:pimeloyl-ACP methyl ester carboxylesterase